MVNDSFSAKLEKGRKFIDKCLEGILFNNNNDSLEINGDPIISVIIPVYKCEKTIKAAIRSVQNQNVKNIEIILVNDLSPDNSSDIIKQMQKEDKRIKIINNAKNMGVLYSRSIGVLESKGKYIFTLDNDDLFFDSDVLEIYKKAENEKYDIIAFSTLDGPDYYSPIYNMRENEFDGRKDNIVITQPNLSIYPITKYENSYNLHDPHIWGKCIKNDLYKRAVNALGEERYSVYNCWNEDVTIFLVICTLADNYIFIKKYGIFHHHSKSSAAFSQNSFNLMNTTINLIAIILDFVPNNYKKYAALGAISLRRSWLFNISDINIKKYLNSIINRILDSQFIEQTYKNRVRNTYKGILF
jgi:glycosyltransferase involved in cell wall biosynthesis